MRRVISAIFWTLKHHPRTAAVFTLAAMAGLAMVPIAELAGAPQQTAGRSGDDIWQITSARPDGAIARDNIAGQFTIVSFNKAQFDARLAAVGRDTDIAPLGIVMTLPMPDGTFDRFLVRESPMLAPELAAAFPEIKTYSGQGLDDPTATTRFGWTAAGFHSIVLSGDSGTSFIDPYSQGNTDTYVVFNKADYRRADGEAWACLVAGEHSDALHRAENAFPISHGTQLRTYRLALAATAEYTAAAPAVGSNAAGSKGAALARMTVTMNRVKGIYERELAVTMTMATGRTNAGEAALTELIFTDAGTDGYSNTDGNAMLTENQTKLDGVIGTANYDIGHVFSTGGGGVAYRPSVCSATQKAGGVTGSSSPTGDAFDVDYVAHEMGHQFGGNHTFNSSTNACSGANRSSNHAYEVGSGVTIQAYAGICGVENLAPNSIDRFHVESLDEMTAFLTNTSTGGSCGTTSSSNTAPTITAPAASTNYTIPLGTPFLLTGAATDPDTGDSSTMTYTWDQFDLGTASTNVASATTDAGNRPLFRSYSATASGQRSFPSMTYVLNNANVPPTQYTSNLIDYLTGETMPTTDRVMNFQLTARDNRSGGGAFSTMNMTVTTDASTGPFKVTSQGSAVTYPGNSSQTVAWDVVGTTASPYSVANVTIHYSSDGFATFSTLVASTENDGAASVTIPNNATTSGRIRVMAVGNIFFDVNDANISVTAASNTVPDAPTNVVGNPGNAQIILSWNAPLNTGGASITGYQVQMASSAGGTYTNVGGCPTNSTQPTCMIAGLTNGTAYFFKIAAINSVGQGAFSTAMSAGVSPVAPCAYTLSADSISVDRLVSNETLTVTTTSACAWTATVASGSTSMLSISSPTSSTNGSGTVTYQVSQNPSTTATRTGTMTIAGQTFTVTQSADSYTVDVTVQQGSTPIAGAFVALIGTGTARAGAAMDSDFAADGTRRKFGAVSSASGIARFRGVVPGTYAMRAHSGGRSVTSGSITVSATVLSATLSMTASSSALTTLGAYGAQTGTIVSDGQTGVFYLNTTAIPSLFRTTDHGGNWSPVTLSSDDPATGLDASSTASAPTTSGYGGEIATIVGNKVWYSFDFGLTWASMNVPTGLGFPSMYWAHINDATSTVSRLVMASNNSANVYVADMTAATPAMAAMAASYKTNAADLIAVGSGDTAPVIAVFDVVSGATKFWAVDSSPASTDSSMTVAGGSLGLAPPLATNGSALTAADATFFKIGGPATGLSIGGVRAPNTVLVYALTAAPASNARMATCTASACSFPLGTTFKNTDETTSTTSTFANPGAGESSLCAANFGAVGSIAPIGGFGSVGGCWLTVNGTSLDVRGVIGINNNTGMAYDAEYDGSTNFVIISGDGQHGASKSARMVTLGDHFDFGPNRPYFPLFPSIADAGTGSTTGGVAVIGITSAVIRQTLFQPSSATNMASVMSFSGGGRTIGSTDGGTTWFTLVDRGGVRMDWWNGVTAGSQWMLQGTTGAGQWLNGTKLAAAADFADTTAMSTVLNGSAEGVGPTDFAMSTSVIFTPGVYGVKGISGTDWVGLGSWDGAKLRIDLTKLTFASGTTSIGTLVPLLEIIVPDPYVASDASAATAAAPATGSNAGTIRMAYCPTGSHSSVADALFVATAAINSGESGTLRKLTGIGAAIGASATPSFTSVISGAQSLTVPSGSNLRDIAVNCADGTVWLARSSSSSGGGGGGGTPTAGILKSTNGGTTIAAITLPATGNAVTALQNVVAIDFSKTNTSQIVAVSRAGDVLVSTDSAATWRLVNDTTQAACVGATTQCGRGFGGEEPGGFAMPPATSSDQMAGDRMSSAVTANSGVLGSGAGLFQVSLDVPVTPTISGSPATLLFGAVKNGAGGALVSVTAAQTITVSFAGSTTPVWSASANQPWVQVTGGSGTGAGTFTVGIINPSNVISGSTTLSATVTLTASNAGTTATIPVTLNITQQTGTTAAPIGQVDTPAQNATDLVGAIGVTGWALDDVGLASVKIYRPCLLFDNQASCQTILGQSVVFVGDAAFLPGARPDVEAAFPTYPSGNAAGWGMQILTNMLPHIPNSQLYGGQGALTLFVYATDLEGNVRLLGRSGDPASPDYATPTFITMGNDTIVKPFGTIDTPLLGGTISGVVANFGWVLTPDSNTTGGEVGDILMTTSGAGMVVYIDGIATATVAYNQCRGTVGNPPGAGVFCNDDIANIFGTASPQASLTARTSNPTRFRNLDATRSAIGAYVMNTTTMTNGRHQIAWGVADSAARGEGIGSRFFTVLNSGADQRTEAQLRDAPAEILGSSIALDNHTPGTEGVYGRTGYALDHAWKRMFAGDTGTYTVRLPESGRLELWLGEPADAGYLVANGTLRPLPVGATLAGSYFAWMPPVGYLGPYTLTFVRGDERIDVTVTVAPVASTPAGTPEVQMFLDPVRVEGPVLSPSTSLGAGERSVRVEGWAFDPKAAIGSGIGAVHVWAKRVPGPGSRVPSPWGTGGASPIFLGAATLDVARPDVSFAHPGASGHAGYQLTAALGAGTWELTAYVWNDRTARWEDARTTSVTIR